MLCSRKRGEQISRKAQGESQHQAKRGVGGRQTDSKKLTISVMRERSGENGEQQQKCDGDPYGERPPPAICLYHIFTITQHKQGVCSIGGSGGSPKQLP